jgi:signal transduction histidine kinase
LENLLHNAVKFNREGGVVRVAMSREKDCLCMTVADEGQGIPEEFLPKMFNPFLQAEDSLTRGHGGVGIGLYLVKKIIDLLGGRIEVFSEHGRGTSVKIALPVD